MFARLRFMSWDRKFLYLSVALNIFLLIWKPEPIVLTKEQDHQAVYSAFAAAQDQMMLFVRCQKENGDLLARIHKLERAENQR